MLKFTARPELGGQEPHISKFWYMRVFILLKHLPSSGSIGAKAARRVFPCVPTLGSGNIDNPTVYPVTRHGESVGIGGSNLFSCGLGVGYEQSKKSMVFSFGPLAHLL